jgi:hypothetical protein
MKLSRQLYENVENYCTLSKKYELNSETCRNAFHQYAYVSKIKLHTLAAFFYQHTLFLENFSVMRKVCYKRKGFFTKAYIHILDIFEKQYHHLLSTWRDS